MVRIYTILLVLALAGCEQPAHGLYIDDSFGEERTEIIKTAIEDVDELMWYLTGEDDWVVYSGLTNIDHENILYKDPNNTGVDAVVAFYSEPPGYDDSDVTEPFVGRAGIGGGDILIALWLLDDDELRPTMLHELLHYIGVANHSDDPDAVMYPQPTATEITETDIRMICDELDVVECEW